MTAKTVRLQRVLKLRALEHRVAKARAATAETKISGLRGIDQRLAVLRAGLLPAQGETSGLSLQSLSEMASRLEGARYAMVAPIAEAAQQRDASHQIRINARHREDNLERLHDREVLTSALLIERRADANQPRLRRNRKLEVI
jgi:hypothetical protein